MAKPKPPPKPVGRPAHEPTDATRRQVETLIGFGLKHDAIAAVIGISDETLRKHYETELNHGKSKMVAQVANSLVKKALSERPDAINAAKFYLQSQGGWTERTETTHEVGDGLADLLGAIDGRTRSLKD